MTKERNAGIDLLKIVSMLMIVTLHMLGHGKILDNFPYMSNVYKAAWLLEILCYGAVNCYALVSGFLLARCNPRKLLELWLQVLFYSVLITVFMNFTLMHGTVPKEEWIYSLFPIVSCKNWYITSYFEMMCLIPFLTLAIEKIDKSLFKKILTGIFLIYILLPVILKFLLKMNVSIDPLTFSQGYSSSWLCILYLFGAYIRKYVDYKKINKKMCLACFLLMVVLTFLSKMLMANTACVDVLVNYTSPTIVIGSLALLLFFADFDVKNAKLKPIIIALSNATLGVYLIHDNNLIRNTIVGHLFDNEFNRAAFKFALIKLIVVVIIVYLSCSLIDMCRGKIFKVCKKLLKQR